MGCEMGCKSRKNACWVAMGCGQYPAKVLILLRGVVGQAGLEPDRHYLLTVENTGVVQCNPKNGLRPGCVLLFTRFSHRSLLH